MCLPWWGGRFGFACLARERALHPSRDGEGAVAAEYATTALPAFRRSGPTSAKRDNGGVPALPFVDARETVLRTVRQGRSLPAVEEVSLADAAGRVLAEDVAADRDSPAVARSVRDGYAVRAIDLPGELEVIGEVRAGERFAGAVGPGQAVEIMTGAPVPAGADAVVMVEHTRRDDGRVRIDRRGRSRTSSSIREAARRRRARWCCTRASAWITPTSPCWRRSAAPRVKVYRRPVVAIIATGDEIVEVDETPEEFQIRNSNAHSLAAQVARAGGAPRILPVARDTVEHTREIDRRGLEPPTCCCFPAASRRASTMWWRKCSPASAPNSISTAC